MSVRIQIRVPGTAQLYQRAALPGWEVIGTVTDREGTGALVRNSHTGICCRANAGVLRSLPQPEVLAQLPRELPSAEQAPSPPWRRGALGLAKIFL